MTARAPFALLRSRHCRAVRIAALAWCVGFSGTGFSAAAEPAPPTADSAPTPADSPLVEKALAVLRDECIGCHRNGKSKGGLKLHSAEALRAGGDSGPVLVPGNAAQSPIIEVLGAQGDPHMPPRKQLSAEAIEALRAWVDAGAPWDASIFERPPQVAPVTLGKMPETIKASMAVAFSRDGKMLARSKGSRVEIRDASQPHFPVQHELEPFLETVGSLAWFADGKTLAAGGFRKVVLLDAAQGKVLGSLEGGFVGDIGAILLDGEGKRLWIADSLAGRGGFVREFDAASRTQNAVWRAHEDSILAMAVSSDNAWLATAGADRAMRRWATSNHALAAVYEGHTNQVLSVAFEPGGTRLATSGADRELKVWDRDSREQDAVLGDKRQVFTSLAWGGDGETLVGVTDRGSASGFSAIRKHSGAQTSETAKTKPLEKVAVLLHCVTISPDGQKAAAGGADGSVHVWSLKEGKLFPLGP